MSESLMIPTDSPSQRESSHETQPKQEETPRFSRQTAKRDYMFGDLNSARRVLNAEVGPVPKVSVDVFCRAVLPPIDDKKLEALTAQALAKLATKSGRWTGFHFDPAAAPGFESHVFKPLEKLINGILKIVNGQKIEAVCDGNNSPYSSRDDRSRPDGWLKVSKSRIPTPPSGALSGMVTRWADIVCPFEFKKSANYEDTHDNRLKILWSGNHILASDPCRRFTFGITIEDTITRLWYFSRSHIMVTSGFDFVKSPSKFVRVIASLALANDQDLGFDPTMQHFWVASTLRQRIQVADKFYITRRTLSDYAASAITGRATRVWEAYEEGSPKGPYVALKDLWMDLNAPSEGEILDTVLSKMAEYAERHPELEDKDFRRYFLTKVGEWRVRLPGDRLDTTLESTRGESFTEVTQSFHTTLATDNLPSTMTEPNSIHTSRSEPRAENSVPPPVTKTAMPISLRRPRHLVHYRIVFMESGCPIHKLLTLNQSYSCLRDSVEGVRWLARIGYVHRDISTGNIIEYKGGGKLSDLEYCKPFVLPLPKSDSENRASAAGMKDKKTGTRQFMATEVLKMKYMFAAAGSKLVYDFRVNPLHDLESIWWIAIWFLTRNLPTGSQLTNQHSLCHWQLFEQIERTLLISPTEMDDVISALPKVYQNAAEMLNVVMLSLRSAYCKTVSSPTQFNPAPYNDAGFPLLFFNEMSRYLDTAPDVSFDRGTLQPPPHNKNAKSRKFGASDDEKDVSPTKPSKRSRTSSRAPSKGRGATKNSGSPVRRSERVRMKKSSDHVK